MHGTLHDILPQSQYAGYLASTAEFMRDFKKSIPAEELQKFMRFKSRPESLDKAVQENDLRKDVAKSLIKAMVEATYEGKLAKAGVTSALGYNFYDLRAPVTLLYPVNVPFRNALPRVGRVNDGYGTAAHWQATRNPGIQPAGVPEGKRSPVATPDNNPYTASYKEIGTERAVTFTAQAAGEGFADNVADEHIRGLHELFLQEEGLILLGNSGSDTGNNGFKLGKAPTPVATLVSGGAIADATKITVAVVALTGLGNPQNAQYGYGQFPTVAGGLTPTSTLTGADGSQYTISCGTSQISDLSNSVTTNLGAGNQKVTVALPGASLPVKGAFGYAWYVSINGAPTLANSFLFAITANPTLSIATTPGTSTQAGNATGLGADNSFNTLDFDGLLTYAAKSGSWTDILGASFTSQKNGRVTEIETILEAIWINYQAGVDEIWGSADAVAALDWAIRYSGTQSSAFRFDYARDSQNNLLGGFVVSGYQSRFAMSENGANTIPIRLHPMVPPGTLYFHVKRNPYPHSRVQNVVDMLVQRDYYSIEWPLTTRQWTFGTYAHEVIRHNMPWIPAVLTGIGAFNSAQ